MDKVAIATPSTITPEAMSEFRAWEQANQRQLIYLSSDELLALMMRRGRT